MLDRAISRLPRMRAWMFSSVRSREVVEDRREVGGRCRSVRSDHLEIGSRGAGQIAGVGQRRLGVEWEGMATPWTVSGPRASTATAAISEESMPPDSPSTTGEKPHFWT